MTIVDMKILLPCILLVIIVSCNEISKQQSELNTQMDIQLPIMQELLSMTACDSIALQIKGYGKYYVYNYTLKECGFSHNESSAIMLKEIIREKYPEICDQVILRFILIRDDIEETYSYMYCK